MVGKPAEPADRRTHLRRDRVHKLFLQVIGDPRHGEEKRLMRCTCENVSPSGIGVMLVEAVPVGSRVEIWINVDDRNLRFLLGGVVRWCRPASHRCLHEVGVELVDGLDEELSRWAELWSQTA